MNLVQLHRQRNLLTLATVVAFVLAPCAFGQAPPAAAKYDHEKWKTELRGLFLEYEVCRLALDEPSNDESLGSFEGRVASVTDGDTLTILNGKKRLRVRLYGIDAPELTQSSGTKAKQALSKLVHRKTVSVERKGTDGFGRTLAILKVGDVNVNQQMLADGWAWHIIAEQFEYSQQTSQGSKSELSLSELMTQSQSRRLGLWADEDPVTPWKYRAQLERAYHQLRPTPPRTTTATSYWLNTSSNVRHNNRCQHFRNTISGRPCTAGEGTPCQNCGG